MKELNSVQMGTAAGAIARLPRPVDFAAGKGCARIRVEGLIPFKNTTAGPLAITGAKVKAAIECLFKTSTLRFGERVVDVVDAAIDYARLREMAIAMSGDDFLIVTPTGAKRLRDVADADVIVAAVAAGATANVTVEVFRPFEVTALGEDAYAYCPGPTAMRQIQWEFNRGANFDASGEFVQGAAADLLFVVDEFDASDDKWPSFPRLYQQEEAGRVSHGPKAPSGLLAMWEYGSAGAATPLSLFSVRRDADAPIHDNARAARVVRDALYTLPVGAYDLNALATVLHSLPDGSERNDVPTGSGFIFEQTAAELNPPRTAWLHIPARTPEEWDEFVGRNVESEAGVKVISAATKSAKGLTGNAAALEPVIIVRRGSADFEAMPGRVYARGIDPTTHVPAGIVASAKAAASGDSDTADAVADKAAGALSKALPGYASAQRFKVSSQRSRLRQTIRGR